MSDIEQATILITNSVRVFSPGTTMARSAKPFISAEIAAVKANLLYAEQLQVNSYLMDILAMGRHDLTRSRMPLRAFMMVCSFLRNSPDETLQEYGVTKSPEIVKLLEEDERIRDTSSAQDMIAFFSANGDKFNEGFNLFRQTARFGSEIAEGLKAFDTVKQSGIVTLQGWSDEPPGFDEPEQDYVNRSGWHLEDLIASGERTVALDAGAAGDLLRGKLHGRPAEIQIASQVLNQLPGFSRATLDEIVDIRHELKNPIRRFRHEMAELSDSVEGELTTPELERLWDRKIQPSLDEIEELTEENKYLRRLADAATDPKTLMTTGGLLTLGFAGLTGIAQVVSAAAGLAALPFDAAKKARLGKKDITKKRFYFVWRMSS